MIIKLMVLEQRFFYCTVMYICVGSCMRTCTCVSASVLVFSAAAAGQRDTSAAGA